ncbi:methyl-accepting chemotaxis protein [Pseudomonas sp. Teo4]|uniref:methyl-accepting chemotaxis protein n=1 Tax=Pseudomonas sp. Teo4 TaxID=3064528 RepID=UPI003A102892
MDDANRQQERTEGVAAAVGQLGSAAQDIARNAASAADQAGQTRTLVEQGSQEVANAQRAMRELSLAIDQSSSTLQVLNGKTCDIGQILDVIRSVSEQTNLLALNAAIEAARAGEAGRGFAVVADEVRNLAHSTQRSTAQIHDLIEQLQAHAGNSVTTMAQSLDSTEKGVLITDQAELKLQHIQVGISAMDSMNLSVAAATEEQTTVIEALNREIHEMKALNQATMANLQDTLQACQALQAESVSLKALVGGFKLV